MKLWSYFLIIFFLIETFLLLLLLGGSWSVNSGPHSMNLPQSIQQTQLQQNHQRVLLQKSNLSVILPNL